jgi:hypothetical protein
MAEPMNLENIVDDNKKSNDENSESVSNILLQVGTENESADASTSNSVNDSTQSNDIRRLFYTSGIKRKIESILEPESNEESKILFEEVDRESTANEKVSSNVGQPRRWTVDEDDRLVQAVKMFGETDWKINSDFVGTRDNGKSAILARNPHALLMILIPHL